MVLIVIAKAPRGSKDQFATDVFLSTVSWVKVPIWTLSFKNVALLKTAIFVLNGGTTWANSNRKKITITG